MKRARAILLSPWVEYVVSSLDPRFSSEPSDRGSCEYGRSKALGYSLLASQDIRAGTEELAGELGALLEKSGTELPDEGG